MESYHSCLFKVMGTVKSLRITVLLVLLYLNKYVTENYCIVTEIVPYNRSLLIFYDERQQTMLQHQRSRVKDTVICSKNVLFSWRPFHTLHTLRWRQDGILIHIPSRPGSRFTRSMPEEYTENYQEVKCMVLYDS